MKRTVIIVAAVLIALSAACYAAIRWHQFRQWGQAGAPRLFYAMNKDFTKHDLKAEMLDGGTLQYAGNDGALWLRMAVTAPKAEKVKGAGFEIDLAPGRHEYLVKAHYARDPNNMRHFRPEPGLYEITRLTP